MIDIYTNNYDKDKQLLEDEKMQNRSIFSTGLSQDLKEQLALWRISRTPDNKKIVYLTRSINNIDKITQLIGTKREIFCLSLNGTSGNHFNFSPFSCLMKNITGNKLTQECSRRIKQLHQIVTIKCKDRDPFLQDILAECFTSLGTFASTTGVMGHFISLLQLEDDDYEQGVIMAKKDRLQLIDAIMGLKQGDNRYTYNNNHRSLEHYLEGSPLLCLNIDALSEQSIQALINQIEGNIEDNAVIIWEDATPSDIQSLLRSNIFLTKSQKDIQFNIDAGFDCIPPSDIFDYRIFGHLISPPFFLKNFIIQGKSKDALNASFKTLSINELILLPFRSQYFDKIYFDSKLNENEVNLRSLYRTRQLKFKGNFTSDNKEIIKRICETAISQNKALLASTRALINLGTPGLTSTSEALFNNQEIYENSKKYKVHCLTCGGSVITNYRAEFICSNCKQNYGDNYSNHCQNEDCDGRLRFQDFIERGESYHICSLSKTNGCKPIRHRKAQ